VTTCGKLIWQKKKIEQDQRAREKERISAGREYDSMYFDNQVQEDGSKLWVFNEKESINSQYLEKLKAMVEKEEEEQKRIQEELEKEEQRRIEEGGEPSQQDQESCSIS